VILPDWPSWFDPTADESDEDEDQPETYAAWCCRLMEDNGGWNP